MKMMRNEHKPGNMAVLVSGATTGLRTFEDVNVASSTWRRAESQFRGSAYLRVLKAPIFVLGLS
jgi:hypothetical protein